MDSILQLKKGTTVENNGYTGSIAEITYDSERKTIVTHDGSTEGGQALALETQISSVIQVSNIAARDALSPTKGDICVVTGSNESYSYNGSSWIKVAVLAGGVTSVNTLTGAVTLSASNVSALADNHAASNVTTSKITNWDAAFAWGNHASAGYITSQRGIDDTPVNGQTTESISSNWAYDHQNSTSAHGSTNANTSNKIVRRDGSGNFAAGIITAALNGNATTATLATSATSATTASTANSLNNANFYRIKGLGVNTNPSNTNGDIWATGNIIAYYSSDKRLKENIKPITNALDKVNQLSGISFDWKDSYLKTNGEEDNYFNRKQDIGLIAQEVEKVLPEIVATKDDGYKAIRYEKIVGLLIEAIKELDRRTK